MNRDETIALFLEGRDEWNRWAEKMLAERKALEEAGEWATITDGRGWLEGRNDKTRDWITQASVDFSNARFASSSPSPDDTKGDDGATIRVAGNVIDFSGFIFPGHALFRRAQFSGIACFNKAQFDGVAEFWEAKFSGDALFQSVLFSGYTRFGRAHFFGSAQFERTQFFSIARFGRARFLNSALFRNARFSGDARFEETKFSSDARFTHTSFGGYTLFADARFDTVPDFDQAHFSEAPRLDNVSVPEVDFWAPCDGDTSAKYRALKRLAIAAHDHEKELEFFKAELRARRKSMSKAFRLILSLLSRLCYWVINILYDVFSDFGRSIWRPALAWAGLAALFAAVYLCISADLNGRAPDYISLAPYGGTQPCLSTPAVAPGAIRTTQAQIAEQTNASAESWSLALKNGFVFLGGNHSEAARRTYGCLYGLTTDGNNTFPVVPRAVSNASIIQNVLSAVLLFLLLLGIRNLLKLK